MKKIFTLAAAILASVSMTWAVDYYTPTAEEVVEVAVTGPAIATHAAIGNASDTYTAESGKTCCDPSDVSKTKSQFALDLKDGNSKKTLVLNIAGCDSICLYCDRNDRGIKAVFTPSEGEPETIYGQIGLRYTGFKLDPNKSYSITFTGYGPNSKDATKLEGQDVRVAAVRLIPGETCDDPEAHLAFTKSTAYVGEQFSYNFGSKSGGDLNDSYTLNGVPAVKGTDYTFTSGNITVLKAGQFVMLMSVGARDGYCAADLSDTILINEATPVASVTVDGPTAGYAGNELTYTATAANATAYQWLVDGVDANTNAATFKYTAVKGDHAIVCKARNEFNAKDEWIASDPIALTVTKLCGELIKAVYDSSSKTSTVTGVVGGTADRNTQDNGKLGSNGHYYGVKLTSGSFMAGDVVTVVASVLNGGNNATIYADKTGTTLLGSKEFDTESLSAEITLTTSADVVYLYRKDSGCNPSIASLSVTRSCEDSKDVSIKSLTINGVEVEEKEGVFAYTVSAKENLAQVAVAYTIHPLATATPASGFNIDVPTVGDPANTQVITVTAEDGTQKEYTVSVAKAAALSTDATLKALSVEGFELTPAFDSEVIEYTITKAYEAELPASTIVTATANDENAIVVVSYDAEVKNQINIVVTAEDEETSKEYHIAVLSAEAVKSLSRVLFSNGFDAFIDNTNRTVKAFYLQGEEAPTATTITAGANCTAGEIVDDKIVVTGADESLAEYAVTLEAVAANTNTVEETAEAGAFDGTETWVKSGLYMGNAAGFNEGKYVLRRQLKSGDAADDQRVIAGLVRAYFFVGNASKLELANTTKNVKVKYAVDGGEYTESEANPLVILLEEGNHMIEVVTNQSSGDCNLSAPKLVKRTATALGNTEAEVKAVKMVENGMLIIKKDGKSYNVLGQTVR